ncbi:MAG: C_GCAxxG_C_C family protein [Anaerolineae bacterium]|nr:C_GCAxxG_C_C family protein [Anaerolineae bacterium]
MPDLTATRARDLFESGWFCTEAVVKAIAEHQNIDSPLIPKMATGLTAGVARTSDLCGAVSGAILGLGLAMGRASSEDSVEAIFAATQTLLAEFKQAYGSTNCGVLTSVDINTPAGQTAFRESGQRVHCAAYVAWATQKALDLIAAQEAPRHEF